MYLVSSTFRTNNMSMASNRVTIEAIVKEINELGNIDSTKGVVYHIDKNCVTFLVEVSNLPRYSKAQSTLDYISLAEKKICKKFTLNPNRCSHKIIKEVDGEYYESKINEKLGRHTQYYKISNDDSFRYSVLDIRLPFYVADDSELKLAIHDNNNAFYPRLGIKGLLVRADKNLISIALGVDKNSAKVLETILFYLKYLVSDIEDIFDTSAELFSMTLNRISEEKYNSIKADSKRATQPVEEVSCQKVLNIPKEVRLQGEEAIVRYVLSNLIPNDTQQKEEPKEQQRVCFSDLQDTYCKPDDDIQLDAFQVEYLRQKAQSMHVPVEELVYNIFLQYIQQGK